MRKLAEVKKDYAQLVESVWALSQDDAMTYNRRLFCLAVTGYLFVYAILFSLVFTLLFMVFPHVVFVSLFDSENLAFIFLLLVLLTRRLFCINTSNPKGYNLNETHFSRLYKTVHKLQKKLKTPAIEEIILVPEFNAAIAQIPQVGIMRRPKITLVIGLELMMATTPEQLTAVIAHELGHLSGSHGRLTAQVSRIGATWAGVMKSLEQVKMWGGGLFHGLINGYITYFNAYSLVLVWQNEYQADRLAAAATSPEVIANTLLYTAVYARYSDEVYWQKICKRADDQVLPPQKIYEGLYAFYKKGFTDEALKQHYIDQAYGAETRYNDTHPALKDRIEALKVQPTEVDVIEKNAAAYFLGEEIKAVVKFFSAQWYEEHKEVWQAHYHYVQKQRGGSVSLTESQAVKL